MTEFVSTRVGVKFSPPTLGVEYKNKSSGEKDALKVVLTEELKNLGTDGAEANARRILKGLGAKHANIINEGVVNMDQVLRLITVLVEKVPAAPKASLPAPPPAAASPLVIKVGGTLKAKMGNWRTAYSGTVQAINDDGTFKVKFEDGEVVKNLEKKWIVGGENATVEQPAKAAAPEEQPHLVIKVGGTLKAKLSNWRTAYSGTVQAINDDGTFKVKFEDGEVVKNLEKKWIVGGENATVEQPTKASAPAPAAGTDDGVVVLKAGATIKAKLGNWKKAYSGEIIKVNGDGTFHVRFEDGEEMKYLQKKWILGGDTAKVVTGDAAASNGGSASAGDESNVLKVGKQIKAKLPNWSKPYGGEILGVNKDGTVHVKFEDGDEMKYLQKKWIVGGDKMVVQQAQGAGAGYTAPDGKKFTDRAKYRQYLMKTQFTFEKKTGKRGADALVKAPGSVNGEPFDMIDLDDCEAAMLGWASQVQVDRCKNSKILVGPVESSIFVRDCSDCEFTIACRQLRTRDCTNCTFHLLSCTDPIIERSTGLTITPYNGSWHGQRSHFEAAKLDPNDNHWRLVFDFNKNGKDNYGVPDPHYELKEGDPGEWRFDMPGTCGDMPNENTVPTDAVATSVSEGGQGHGGGAESMMKEMMKEKSDGNQPPAKKLAPWTWVKETDRKRVQKDAICRVTFSRTEGQASRNSSFYEGTVLAVNDDKTFHVKYEDGDEEKDVALKFLQIRQWDD
jgi:translation initiation factor IF-1